jgi:basic amino acid/polyamine antiporter, APA family
MIPACRVCDPQKTIPRATFIGTVLTAVIFICVSIVPMLLIPQKQLAASNAPFADLFAQALGARSGQLVALFVIISGLGALNGWTLLIGDVTQGLARHGHFPRFLARENRNGAPTAALWVTGLIASVMLVSNYSESIGSLFTFFIVVVTAACLPLYVVCSLAVIVLGSRGENGFSGRAWPLWIVVGTCGAVYCGWVAIGVGLKPLLWTLGLGAVCAPIYWTSTHLRRRAQAMAS